MTLEMYGRLDTGLKFFKSSGGRLHFFRMGMTMASLYSTGISAHCKDWLTRCVRDGSNTSRFSFNSHVGIGSSEHDLVAERLMILAKSCSVTGVNCDKEVPLNTTGSGLV